LKRSENSEYLLRFVSGVELRDTARHILESWFPESEFRPEFYGLGEPIREAISSLVDAATAWEGSESGIMLRRRTPPIYTADISGKTCTVWLSHRAGDDGADRMIRFLVPLMSSSFASACTRTAFRAKHWITFNDRVGETEMAVGLELGSTVPGIYWKTYFGRELLAALGEKRVFGLKAAKVEALAGGCLVTAYESSDDCGTDRARLKEREIAEQLGAGQVFDISSVDPASLRLDPKTSEMIEAEFKARKDGSLRSDN
jgi:hypothetical protein